METQNELETQSAPVKKRIAFFCIPAFGHTNPMLPVAAELVQRHAVRAGREPRRDKRLFDG